jgi:hypothetical protein
MDSCLTFYLCPICFETAEMRKLCHDRLMVCYDGRCQTDEARKPLQDGQGDLRSQAPRWFLRARGWSRSGRAAGEGVDQRSVNV